MKDVSANRAAKEAAGRSAAAFVRDGMLVGVGTGSTAAFFIEELVRRRSEEGLDIQVAPTSFESRMACMRHGLRLVDPAGLRSLDMAVDGADEVDLRLDAIKGGGACHTIEKVIASLAHEYILVVDESKLVDRIGSRFPIPVEIIPAALGLVQREIESLGHRVELRSGSGKDGPVVSDNGNLIGDIRVSGPIDPLELGRALDSIPGLVGHGLFVGIAKMAVVGKSRESGAEVEYLRPGPR